MDTLTHALIGAAIAHASQPGPDKATSLKAGQRISLGALAAAFPDIDYATYLIDPLLFISDWHRAETHSLILLPLWAILLAWLFTRLTQQREKIPEAFIICCLSLISHICTDLITSWGTQVFAPFSEIPYAFATSFVIDPYLTVIVLTALIIGVMRQNVWVSRLGLIMLVCYLLLQAVFKLQANDIARHLAVERQWKIETLFTMPQPLSPMHWKIIIDTGEVYHLAYLNLAEKADLVFLPEILSSLANEYRTVDALNWKTYYRYGQAPEYHQVKKAWHQPVFENFRHFAQYPAFIETTQLNNARCYWFVDLRFILPKIKPSFVYAICQYPSGEWQAKQSLNK